MSTQTISLLEDQFVDMIFITRLTGLSDKWFYKFIQDGEFPKLIKLSRSSHWLKSEVGGWLQYVLLTPELKHHTTALSARTTPP